MRIAHFVHRYPPAPGGAESYFARLSESLVRQGHEVHVLTTNAFDLTAFWTVSAETLPPGTTMQNGVQVTRLPIFHFPGRKYFLKLLSLFPHRSWQCMMQPCSPVSPALWQLAGRIEHRFDLVHASAFPYTFPLLCGLRLARRQGIPFCLTPFVHTGDPDNPQDQIRASYTSGELMWLASQTDMIFAQTQGERRCLVEHGISPDKIVLQGLGVDPSEVNGGDRQSMRQKWHIADDEIIIGHLANQSEEKGTCDLLRAAAILWDQGLRFRVVLAGPQMPNFQRFWRNYQYQEYVLQFGKLSEMDKRHFYSAIDLFVLPSRSDSFGLVLLEAWANGIPNIGYRAGGITEIIRHGVDGLMVECGNTTSLAHAMESLMKDKERRARMGRNGRARLLTDFHWSDKLALVEQSYEHLANRLQGVVSGP